MKKALSLLLAALMLLSLVACGSNGGDKDDKNDTKTDPAMYEVTEPVTIEFWHNYSNKARADFLQSVTDEFNASQDKITVELKNIGDYPVIAEQVAGAISAGTGLPAMSTINVPRVLNFAASGIIEPLDGYLANSDQADGFYTEMQNALADKNGDIYGIPFGISAGCCIYNKTVLDELGLPFPETWEDFKVWCKNVYEATGKVAFGFAYDFNYMNNFFINVTGIDPLGDGTVSQLDDERVISFLKDMRELVQAGYCSYMGTSVNKASDDQMAAFALGELIAFTDTTSTVAKAITSVDFEVGTAVGVSGTKNAPITTASGASLVIYADNDQNVKNAAFQFAMYLTSKENTATWAVNTCMFPVREGCDLAPMYEKYPGSEGVFSHGDSIVGKNKSSAMQPAMELVVGVVGEYVKGNLSEDQFASKWESTKKEVDTLLADAS